MSEYIPKGEIHFTNRPNLLARKIHLMDNGWVKLAGKRPYEYYSPNEIERIEPISKIYE